MFSSACALSVALALQVAAQTPVPPAPPAAATVAAGDRPFQQLISNLGRDVRALPSANTALILGVGGGGAVVVRPLDDNLSNWAHARGSSSYTKTGDIAGQGWVQAGAAVATYAIGVASRSTRTTHVGSDLIRAQFLTGIFTQALKVTAQRERPGGGSRSFPSGHTSATFATAAVLDGNFGARAGVPAYALAGFVAWTRLRDDQHWLTDTIIGATIGTIVGRTVTTHDRPPRRKTWTIVPSATGRAVALFLVK